MEAALTNHKNSTVRDMTGGSIVKQITLFSLPLMLGNLFQMLYNTVDSIVLGNFVSTQALAAVGATTMIVNMLVFFFNGFSVGAGVVIANRFGAHDREKLHIAIETAMAATFLLSVLLSIGGLVAVEPMLRLMSTPEDVFPEAATYLKIYIGGISGLLIYNVGSGILRAVGDTTRPLYFLILSSILNIFLDLFFVLVLKMGIAGVAIATVISQYISAGFTLLLLSHSKDIYRLSWNDLRVDPATLHQVVAVGLPAAVQSILTSFSNIFVQSYINYFGSSCMAGWSSYNKLDQFIMLFIQSMGLSATTFVSQNIGAGLKKRANKGAVVTLCMAVCVTLLIATLLYVFAAPAVRLFTDDGAVIEYGVLFIRTIVYFFAFNCINHVLAGALQGQGDSRGPMIIMLVSFVLVRQIYLYLVTHYVANTPFLVGFGYPVGWMTCSVVELTYFFIIMKRQSRKARQTLFS